MSFVHPLSRGAPANRTILVVDDEIRNLIVLESLLTPLGHRVITATNGDEALERVRESAPDLIILDVLMPKRDGFSVCAELKSREETRLIPVIMVTTLDEVEHRVRAFECDADDFLTKPINRSELTARIHSGLRIKSLYDRLESSERVLFAFVQAMEARDPYTNGHSLRVARYAVDLAVRAGLAEEQCRLLWTGGLLHDVGKIGVPDAILQKPGPLTDEERAVVRSHTVLGERICLPLRTFGEILPLVRSHHERLDGSGYPDGLPGDRIAPTVRILAIADVFDALTSSRSYRAAMAVEAAAAILETDAREGRLDAELVGAALPILPLWLEQWGADGETAAEDGILLGALPALPTVLAVDGPDPAPR